MADLKLNIALDPPQGIARQAISASKELARAGGAEFVLDGTHLHPHITVLMGFFPEDQLESIRDAVEQLARASQPVELLPMRPYANRGYVGIDFKTTTDLLMLKDRVEQAVGERMNGEAGEGGAYRPHLTLLKYRSPRTKAPLTRFAPFTCTTLTIFEAGKHGTCIRRLASFELG